MSVILIMFFIFVIVVIYKTVSKKHVEVTYNDELTYNQPRKSDYKLLFEGFHYISGIKYHNGIRQINDSSRVIYYLEKDNEFDKKAVGIFTLKGKLIGYVPRKYHTKTRLYNYLSDDNVEVTARISQNRDGVIGVQYRVYKYQKHIEPIKVPLDSLLEGKFFVSDIQNRSQEAKHYVYYQLKKGDALRLRSDTYLDSTKIIKVWIDKDIFIGYVPDNHINFNELYRRLNLAMQPEVKVNSTDNFEEVEIEYKYTQSKNA